MTACFGNNRENKIKIRNGKMGKRKKIFETYTTTSADGNLDGIPSRLTYILQVEWPMAALIITAIDHKWICVCRHLNTCRPICVHVTILMMETLQL